LHLRRADALLFVTGALLALASFLAPAWPLLAGGVTALRGWMPGTFAWPLYLAGLAGMATAQVRVVYVR
jgi:ABC-type nitrate/sulfonate/bicarbonate transport system substrate-binding protein